MPKTQILSQGSKKSQTIIVDVFAGVDRSTARHRIEGKGERLYEAKNVFPYIQGRLQRRQDSVQTNSRSSDNAFPTFPAQSLSGNAKVKKIIEFNNHICIFYEDDGDTGKLLMDRFDTGANTLTAVTTKISNAGGAFAFQTAGEVGAAIYNNSLYVDVKGNKVIVIDKSWNDTINVGGNDGGGVCETFLQSFFHLDNNNPNSEFGRTAPSGTTIDVVEYSLEEAHGDIIKLLSFGYQTSSSGATTLMLIFKESSIWVLTGIGATESLEQVVGNIGLAGTNAVTYTPLGVCFVGRDAAGLLNIYLLDRSYFTLQTIGHKLYEELNRIPKSNFSDIILTYYNNRAVRIAITKTGDSVPNLQEYWLDLYNGLKKRTYWGPFLNPASNSTAFAISYSGGIDPNDAGYFKLLKEGNTYKIYEDINTDTYNSTDSEWDDQVWRTKMYDFGNSYGIVNSIILVALDNEAKFKVYYEKPKLNGSDDDTTSTLIGSYQMGNNGDYRSKPIRIAPAVLARQIAIKFESNYDVTDNKPFEPSQIGFTYEVTGREVIE